MRLEWATATLTRLTFRDNIGGSNAYSGGADMLAFTVDVTISECRFSNSRGGTGDAMHGGALQVMAASNCRVLDSTFEDAYSEGDGGSVVVTGGSNAEFIRTTFRRSEAAGYGGIAAIEDESTALFQQCDLSEGLAGAAGGIYITEGSVVNVTRCTLAYCHSQYRGYDIPGNAGAIAAYGDAFIQDSVFEHNEADGQAGDLYVLTGSHIELSLIHISEPTRH